MSFKSHQVSRITRQVIRNGLWKERLQEARILSQTPVQEGIKPLSLSQWLSPSSRYIFARLASTHGEIKSPRAGVKDTRAQAVADERRLVLNRLLYRSRQRGYLELDLLLGKWAEENIQQLDDEHLKALIEVLDLENPDLWKWITGQEPAPEFLTANPVFMAIHKKIMGNLNTHAPAETRATPGQPWVRGWDDNRRVGGPQAGNQ